MKEDNTEDRYELQVDLKTKEGVVMQKGTSWTKENLAEEGYNVLFKTWFKKVEEQELKLHTDNKVGQVTNHDSIEVIFKTEEQEDEMCRACFGSGIFGLGKDECPNCFGAGKMKSQPDLLESEKFEGLMLDYKNPSFEESKDKLEALKSFIRENFTQK